MDQSKDFLPRGAPLTLSAMLNNELLLLGKILDVHYRSHRHHRWMHEGLAVRRHLKRFLGSPGSTAAALKHPQAIMLLSVVEKAGREALGELSAYRVNTIALVTAIIAVLARLHTLLSLYAGGWDHVVEAGAGADALNALGLHKKIMSTIVGYSAKSKPSTDNVLNEDGSYNSDNKSPRASSRRAAKRGREQPDDEDMMNDFGASLDAASKC